MQQIIIAVIALALLGGGVWYVLEGRMSGETNQMSGSETTNESDLMSNLSGRGSFMNLLGFGNSIRCEFTSTFDGDVSSGVFYTNGSKYRVEATTVTAEGTFESNMIDDGAFTYMWGNSAEGEMAIKMEHQAMAVSDGEVTYSNADFESPTPFDVEEEVDYDCARWSASASMFVPPNDIEFMDMAAMMEASMQGMPEGFTMPAGW